MLFLHEMPWSRRISTTISTGIHADQFIIIKYEGSMDVSFEAQMIIILSPGALKSLRPVNKTFNIIIKCQRRNSQKFLCKRDIQHGTLLRGNVSCTRCVLAHTGHHSVAAYIGNFQTPSDCFKPGRQYSR